MNDYNRCNKLTGVYWLTKAIDNLQIKISIKLQDGILSLPRFEEFTQKTKILLETRAEEFTFRWQQKVFSQFELNRFSDVHSCMTDTELKYNEVIENTDAKPFKVFSYVHEDYHLPLLSNPNKQERSNWILINLGSKLEWLSLNNVVERIFGGDGVSTQHLFRSEENITRAEEEWRAMHIIFDKSEYSEDSQLLFRQEVPLLSLYHNILHNYMIVTPDVNNLDFNPYTMETGTGVPCGYQYAVDIDFDQTECGEELVLLLTKLLKRWQKKQRKMLHFVLPPLEKRQYFVTLEILSATGFDMDNLYVEFDVKVPEEIQCNVNLHGRTHTSTALTVDGHKQWNFAHIVEFSVELATDAEPPPIKVFLEAISTDWWCRHRTEGYCYHPLTLEPGRWSKQLRCCRPEELNPVEAESRRFFVGGCHLIKDLDVLAEPQMKNGKFKFVTTGSIKVRCSIISQAHKPGVQRPAPSVPQPGTSNASALIHGAEVALRKYKKARAKLAAATKDIDGKRTGGGDG